MMIRFLTIAILAAIAGLCFAQGTPVGNDSADSRAELINTLLAMSPEDRRATLKGMNYSERKGLWFQVIKERAIRKGKTPLVGNYKSRAKQKNLKQGNLKRQETKRALGTINYDTNTPTTSFSGGSIIGNRFDTHTGMNVFASGSVNTVQAVVVEGTSRTTSSAGFVLLGPQTTMGGALAIFSNFTGATGTQDTVTFSGIAANYTGSSFFVLFGDFNNSYVPAFGPGTTMGQGHHGVAGNTGGMGPNIVATSMLTGLNALIRVTGNVVPVELMKFEVK